MTVYGATTAKSFGGLGFGGLLDEANFKHMGTVLCVDS
jgi:hypothetical protein